MKIKRPPKKTPSSNAQISSFLASLSTTPDDSLTPLLQTVLSTGWTWPRTDLQHWIVPLNRFDEILGRIVVDYDLGSLDHAQTNAFTPRTRELLLAILRFEKVLLENSTNRKIYASFDVSVPGAAFPQPSTPLDRHHGPPRPSHARAVAERNSVLTVCYSCFLARSG